MMVGAFIAIGVSLSSAAPAANTDFGVRIVGVRGAPARATEAAVHAVMLGRFTLSGAQVIGSHWGRVTSTYRNREHNRQVGGVPNSFHLAGRAIDIARRPGVSHDAIEAAYRRAGYRLVESLDEGDHSHFAFGSGAARMPRLAPLATQAGEVTQWKIVFAPR